VPNVILFSVILEAIVALNGLTLKENRKKKTLVFPHLSLLSLVLSPLPV
jgi:hypothetical protein